MRTGITSTTDVTTIVPRVRAYLGLFTGDVGRGDNVLADVFAELQEGGGTATDSVKVFCLAHKHALTLRPEQAPVVAEEPVASVPPSGEGQLAWDMAVFIAAVAKLSLNHREVLFLIEGARLRYREAATVCGCQIGTIRSRLARARIKLYALLPKIETVES